jgi:hypothetical protein
MKPTQFYQKLILIPLLLTGCAVPKYIPQDIDTLHSPQALAIASREAYQNAKTADQKEEKLKFSQGGMLYAEKCLKKDEEAVSCLYYDVLNTGTFIQNHFPGYQKRLQLMVSHCEKVIQLDPGFENGGCYRVLGNIYREVPSFSLSSNSITKDIEKSVEYLRQGVQVAPQYALNHLFLAKSLDELGETEEAKQELAAFDRLRTPAMDTEYPDWKKERDNLAKKLF